MRKKNYEYILLDWDGNLAKTLDLWLAACRQLLERRGISEVSDEEIGASFGAFPEHMKMWGIKDIPAALSEVDTLAKRTLPEVELYPDALMVLQALHKSDKKLALITSSIHENVEHLLKKHDVAKFFRTIIAADDVTHHKPHPESLEKALQNLGGTKRNAIMIGDSDKDLGAAKNAGIDSLLFYPPEHKKFYNLEKLKELTPTHVVHDFKEVLKIV